MFKAQKKADKQVRTFMRRLPHMLSYTLGFLVGASYMKKHDCDAANRAEFKQWKYNRNYGV